VVVYCDGAKCLFTERTRPGKGLPVLFVDEQLYQELPTSWWPPSTSSR
jgi:hypothetical protein